MVVLGAKPLTTGVLLVALAGLIMLPASPAAAQSTDNCAVEYQDRDGNGLPDVATILCPFAGNPLDRVSVYDRAGNMQATGNWETSVDFEDDLWVFDAQGDSTANLIIDFHRDGAALVADLFTDQDGDGAVAYDTANGVPEILESDFWTVRVTAPDGWWKQADKVNFNLDIVVDGPVGTITSYLRFLRRIPTDGQPDFTIKVRDLDQSGQPDYDFRFATDPLPTSWSLYRVNLLTTYVRQPIEIQQSVFWPYLGPKFDLLQRYGVFAAPLQMDWDISQLAFVAEFVPSRGDEHNCFIYSMPPYVPGETYIADFENPFCFYDLANDQDHYPELATRIEYFLPNDPYFISGTLSYPVGWARYSWDQDNDRTWDYKVGLLGRSLISSTVDYPEISVRTIPYGDMPNWLIDQAWDVVFFAAVEFPYWTTEGIYEWGPTTNLHQGYMSGLLNEFPADEYSPSEYNPPAGMRGEYTVAYGNARPDLYLSAVDGRLHLVNMQGGFWLLCSEGIPCGTTLGPQDPRHYVVYENLDGDETIDQWTYLEDGVVQSVLIHADGYVVYAHDERIMITQANTPEVVFRAFPPRDNTEWATLGALLDQYGRDFAPEDFQGMYAQFDGPEWQVIGATLHDYRPVEDGFRFVLDLQPNFQAGGAIGLTLDGLSPGPYLVTHTLGEGFRVFPVAAPDVAVSRFGVNPEVSQVVELQEAPIAAVIENRSLQDIHAVQVRFFAQHEGTEEAFFETALDIHGQEEQTVTALWAAPMPGEWSLRVEVEVPPAFGAETVSAASVTTVSVMPNDASHSVNLLSLDGMLPAGGLPLLLIVLSLSIMAASLFLLIARTRTS